MTRGRSLSTNAISEWINKIKRYKSRGRVLFNTFIFCIRGFNCNTDIDKSSFSILCKGSIVFDLSERGVNTFNGVSKNFEVTKICYWEGGSGEDSVSQGYCLHSE